MQLIVTTFLGGQPVASRQVIGRDHTGLFYMLQFEIAEAEWDQYAHLLVVDPMYSEPMPLEYWFLDVSNHVLELWWDTPHRRNALARIDEEFGSQLSLQMAEYNRKRARHLARLCTQWHTKRIQGA